MEKPIFTADELNPKKTHLHVGYHGELINGYNLTPAQNPVIRFVHNLQNRFGKNKAKRDACHEINKFGYAVYMAPVPGLLFGIPYRCPNGLNATAKSALDKYTQTLKYYLHQAGWQEIEENEHDFLVPLNNTANIKNLQELSQHIGFYYKGERPTITDITKLYAAQRTK